jgi:hypothetical protein
MKLSLSEDWRSLHKRLSVILPAVCAAISAFGPEIRDAWHSVPDDLKAIIPAHLQQAIAYAILFCALVGAHYVQVQRRAPDAPPAPPENPQ